MRSTQDTGHQYEIVRNKLRCVDKSCHGSASIINQELRIAKPSHRHSSRCTSAFDNFELTIFVMTLDDGFCTQQELEQHREFLQIMPQEIRAIVETAINVSICDILHIFVFGANVIGEAFYVSHLKLLFLLNPA